MKKVALFMAIILVISMPLTVSATPWALNIRPNISFEGTTATCYVMVVGNNTSEHIEVTMKLMYGNSLVASWSDDGYGYVRLQENATVTKDRTYTLVVEVTVNNVAQQPVSINGTC